jgi:hypothetical protein
MRLAVLVIGTTILSACSTGVVQTDKDTYIVSEKAGGCGFASGGGQVADAYREANDFCAARNLHVETVSSTSRNGVPFAHCADATLTFRCVP